MTGKRLRTPTQVRPGRGEPRHPGSAGSPVPAVPGRPARQGHGVPGTAWDNAVMEAVRLDIWLDIACLARTRSQAKELCDGGRVEINGARAKPNRQVRPGDRLVVTVAPGRRRELVVLAVTDSHVAKTAARALYDDVTPQPTAEEMELRRLQRLAPPPAPPRGSGRPEKRDRRRIERTRGR